MKSASEELKKLRLMAEKSLIKTDELDKVLAQVEASLERTEARKILDKKHKLLIIELAIEVKNRTIKRSFSISRY